MHHRQYQDDQSALAQYDKELRPTAEMLRSGQKYEPSQELMCKTQKENVPEYHRMERRIKSVNSPMVGASVLQYTALSDKQREQLLAGEHVVISGAELAADARKVWPEGQSFDFALERSSSGYMLRCAVKPGNVRSNLLLSSAYYDDTAYKNEADQSAQKLVADADLAKELPADWKPVTETDIRIGEGSAAVPGTMSDGLLELAKTANMPIVAQYISEYNGAKPDWAKNKVTLASTSAKTVGQRLAELLKLHTFTISRDGQFLLAKSLLWHRMRGREVPEAKIRAWQKDCAGLNYPTLETYVDMASMTWEQKRGTIESTPYWMDINSDAIIYLARCEYPLRIYGTLSSDQRSWLQSGQVLPVASLNSDQQLDFMSGYEVREKPTFQNVTDQDWPNTASFVIEGTGTGSTLLAVAGARSVGTASADPELVQIPKDTPKEEIGKLWEQQIMQQMPSVQKKLLETVAKDHPEIAMRDVRVYALRYYSFTMKLGDEKHCSDMPVMVRIR